MLKNIILELKYKISTLVSLAPIKHKPKSIRIKNLSQLNRNTLIGENVVIKRLKIIGRGRVEIFDGVTLGDRCLIISSIHNYDQGLAIPYDTSSIDKTVVINRGVYIYDNVIILGGVSIGEGSIILPGSCVTKDVPPFSVVIGHPAKVVTHLEKYL